MLRLLVLICSIYVLGIANVNASANSRDTFLTDGPYLTCFQSGCHIPNNGHHPISADISPDDCAGCHAPINYDTNDMARPVHTPDLVGRRLFKGIDACVQCHETGMQNKKDHPNLDCLKCHGPGKKADVHAIGSIGEGDNGKNADNNNNIATETGGHRACLNCHYIPWAGQDLTQYYALHLDGGHRSTIDPTIIDPADPEKSCVVCHMDPQP